MSGFIDYGSVNARVAAFDAANNTNGPSVVIGGYRFYPNGAYRDVNPMGVLADPPNDEQERGRNILAYHNELLRRAMVAFNERKEHYASHARVAQRERRAPAVPWSTEEAVKELKALQAAVQDCQARVAAARKKLLGNKPDRERQLEEMSDRNKQLAGELLTAVEQIEI